MFGHDGAGELMEIGCPAIVAESVPSFPHRARACCGQFPETREAGQESRVVLANTGHLRLLKHELGDEDSVRIPGSAPGKVSTPRAKPPQETALEAQGALWGAARHSGKYRSESRADGSMESHGQGEFEPREGVRWPIAEDGIEGR